MNHWIIHTRWVAGGWRLAARYPKYPKFLLWVIAGLCSLILTGITLTTPVISGDWARLDHFGIYIPNKIEYPWPGYAAQVVLWAGMIGCLVALAGQRPRYASPLRHPQIGLYSFSVVSLTLLGFGLRLHSLNNLPLIIDEIGFAAWSSDILHGQHIPIFAPGHNGNPVVYSWLVAGSMSLFGQNAFAIRLIPLLFGTLSIPAIYVLGCRWRSRRVGLLAAAFLATYPAHVHFSQLSMYNIVDPFFAMLALGVVGSRFSVFGSQSSANAWILTGVLAGTAQYFYHGSRLLIILIIVYIIVRLIKTKTLHISESLGLCVQFFGAFFIVSLPRFAPMIAGGLPVTGNLEGIHLPADLAANSLRSILAWIGQPDISPFWLGSGPLLEWPALIAFMLGLFICLRQWRDARHIVLLVSLVLTTLFGSVI